MSQHHTEDVFIFYFCTTAQAEERCVLHFAKHKSLKTQEKPSKNLREVAFLKKKKKKAKQFLHTHSLCEK